MWVRSWLSSPWNITAPPILTDSEIDSLIAEIFSQAMKWGGGNQSQLAQLWVKFNTTIARKSSSEDEMISNIDSIFETFMEFSMKKFDTLVEKWDEEEAKEFIHFINFLLKLLKIKKVYNNIPRQDFTRFAENEDHTQILQLTLPRWEDLGENSLTHGGSCHNWSIVFKQYFDQLGITSSIIFCNPFSNHSFTLLELKWKYYIFDPVLRVWWNYISEVTDNPNDEQNQWVRNTIFVWMNQEWVIQKIFKDISWMLNLEVEVQKNTPRWWEEHISDALFPYDDIGEFTTDLDMREIDYIIVWYRLEDERGFEIDFNRESPDTMSFSLKLWKDKDKVTNEEDVNKKEILTSFESKVFLWRFLNSYFWRKFNNDLVGKLLREYQCFIRGEANKLYETQRELLSDEEIGQLSSWVWESSNFQLFEAFFKAMKGNLLGTALFWKKNTELLEHFQKATNLMHKKSVVRFLMLWALIPSIDTITHMSVTYERNKLRRKWEWYDFWWVWGEVHRLLVWE